jgi:hypothetical protein
MAEPRHVIPAAPPAVTLSERLRRASLLDLVPLIGEAADRLELLEARLAAIEARAGSGEHAHCVTVPVVE